MSKQYLTAHTVDNAHITDIYGIAATQRAVLSVSGSSDIHIHETASTDFALAQSIPKAHKVGAHHISASGDGKIVASAGFGGELKIWALAEETEEWKLSKEMKPGAGEVWAIALSENGKFLAATTSDGRINVWDISGDAPIKIKEYETAGAGAGVFGTSVDLSSNGKFTASGHQNGTVYLFDNELGRLKFCLSGLAKPIRAVAFSPGCTRLAAAGDSGIIAVYDMKHGEQTDNLIGHSAWIMSLSWNSTGEYLLSGSFDGKVKVWSIERGACVATHSETDKALWAVRWLPRTSLSKAEMFVTGGANRSLIFYREASGG
ncbi:Meiotic recombination protein rec14 [Zalerion maritima]|uniref:Meiotic recombination protein rec14 n=1 Tax=Zalerion maritima TaxID=339359 RepID=A0AAD5RJQ9_9PEZI|nr:Meiotic recombination protein rec14 [Zalerion maritima]